MTDPVYKTRVMRDFAYATHLIKEARVALRADNLEELEQIAPDLVAAVTTLTEYVEQKREVNAA